MVAFRESLEHSPHASVGARHVCAEGCQFVTEREQLFKGERFTFVVDGSNRIAGTVRWVVRDRVGFAFDAPIAERTRTALLARTRNYRSIDLYQD